MPNLPEIPGRSLIAGITKRTTRVVVAAAGAGAMAVGGLVAKRLRGHGGDHDGATADPIAETPTAPPGAEEKPVPKPKPAKPKPPRTAPAPNADKPKPKAPPKPKAAKPKPKAEPEENAKPAGAKAPAKPKPAKPKAPKAAKPPKVTGTDAPPKPEVEPGNQTGGKDPHHALNNPVVDDPDLTEFPDPYDTREDPLADPDHPTGAESTSEPPLQQDPELENGGKPPRRDKLDD
jgi:hypothetical protein